MPLEPVWDEATCRDYAESMRRLAPRDHRNVASRILRHLGQLHGGATVIEVASGPGFLAFEVARHLHEPELSLVDSAPAMLQVAQAEAALAGRAARLIEASAERIALDDGVGDVILCKNLMNCVEPSVRIEVVHEIVRLLAPGGRAFVVDFDQDGSRVAAIVIGLLVRLLVGAHFQRDFRRAFARRLDPTPLADAFAARGCGVAIERFGPSFMIVATRNR